MIRLYDYQETSKQDIKLYFEYNQNKIMLQMPTGAGKTRLFCSLIHDYFISNKDFRCIVVAHRHELLEQAGNSLNQHGIEYGIIKSGVPFDKTYRVQVASVGSLKSAKFLDDYPIDLIVIDEAHHSPANSYTDLFDRFPKSKFLGVTATPIRMDGEPLGDYYNKLILGPTITQLIDNRSLCPVKLFKPKVQLEGLEETIVGSDYNNSKLSEVVNQKAIRSELISSYRKYCDGLKGIVYAINKDHARAICQDYTDNGIDAAYIISGEGSQKERDSLIDDALFGQIVLAGLAISLSLPLQ